MSYEFWEEYNNRIKNEIKSLCKKKEKLRIDLHMHTNYSSDGKQSLDEIIKNTYDKFDIIAITDHDSLDVYDELYELLQNNIKSPIIIPGIEFTTDNVKYGNQAHIVQLFINPCDKELKYEVERNYNASFNRSKIQLYRLKYNEGLQVLLKKYNIKLEYDEYIEYLSNNGMVPEYDTLVKYIIFKTEDFFDNFDILKLQEEYNSKDVCVERRYLKEKAFAKIRNKYKEEDKHSSRMLLSILGVRSVDDDWFNYRPSGSISVNSYGQLKIEEIDQKYLTVFAHPTESKLDVVNEIIKSTGISAIEINVRNKYENISKLYDMIKENNLMITKGSDNHELNSGLYDNLDFFEIESMEVEVLCR